MRKSLFVSLVLVSVFFLSLTVFVSANPFGDFLGKITGKSVSSGVCGDGKLQPGEQCETDLKLPYCTDFGFTGGNLGCSSCKIDTSECYNTPIETCTDSDGGLDYYVRGKGSGDYQGDSSSVWICGANEDPACYPRTDGIGYTTAYDVCASETQLNEVHCLSDDVLWASGYFCPNGCLNGACVGNVETVTVVDGCNFLSEETKSVIKQKITSVGASILLDERDNIHLYGYFVAITYEGQATLLQLYDVYNQTTGSNSVANDRVKFGDAFTGETFETSFLEVEGKGTLNVGGRMYIVFFEGTGSDGQVRIDYPDELSSSSQTINFENCFGSAVSQICTDTDEGVVPYVPGNVTDRNSINHQDSCLPVTISPGTAVQEYYCDSQGNANYSIINCPNGCLNGACSEGVGSICTNGDSSYIELSEGETTTLWGVEILVSSADETNLVLSAKIRINGEFFELTSESPRITVPVNGQAYTFELVSTTDTSATIKVTCGVSTDFVPTCSDSDGGSIYQRGTITTNDPLFMNPYDPNFPSYSTFSDYCSQPNSDQSAQIQGVDCVAGSEGCSIGEFYCENISKKANFKLESCPQGCSDGACISPKKNQVEIFLCGIFGNKLPFCDQSSDSSLDPSSQD